MADHDYDPLYAALFDPDEAPTADIDPTHWIYGILLFLFSGLTILFGMGAYSLYVSYALAGDICNDLSAPLWCTPLQQQRGTTDASDIDGTWSGCCVRGGSTDYVVRRHWDR